MQPRGLGLGVRGVEFMVFDIPNVFPKMFPIVSHFDAI
jgi:hypothetical protein